MIGTLPDDGSPAAKQGVLQNVFDRALKAASLQLGGAESPMKAFEALDT